MNKKSWMVLRIVAGMYLAFLGIQIISQVSKEQPSNLALMVCAAVVFIGVGVAYAGAAIRSIFKMSKGEEGREDDLQMADQEYFESQEVRREVPDIQLKQEMTAAETEEKEVSEEERSEEDANRNGI